MKLRLKYYFIVFLVVLLSGAVTAEEFNSLLNSKTEVLYKNSFECHRTESGETHFVNSRDASLCDSALELLAKGASLERPLKSGELPLHFACRIGSLPLAKLFLENVANPNGQDRDGATALHYLCKRKIQGYPERNIQLASLLLKKGADVEAETISGVTPLHVVFGPIGRGSSSAIELAKLLLQSGADPNRKNFCCGMTPLHLAVSFCGPEALRLVLNYGGKPSIQNSSEMTSFDIASMRRDEEILEVLGASNPEQNSSNSTGEEE